MELYHLCNRGVDKRDIFLDDRDRFRFVHGLVLFNTANAANNTTYLLEKTSNDLRSRYSNPIIDVHAWCLMKNHYHLLLSEQVENGISLFIRKLNIGYAKYFNKRHDRSGYLFQGRTRRIRINSDAYFLHILNYVHFNPLDYFSKGKEWRTRGLADPLKAHEYLVKYRWSSYSDYCGKRNFPSVLTTDLFGKPSAKFKRNLFDYSGTDQESLPPRFLLE